MATKSISCFFFSPCLNRIPQTCILRPELVMYSTNDVTGWCSTPGRDIICTELHISKSRAANTQWSSHACLNLDAERRAKLQRRKRNERSCACLIAWDERLVCAPGQQPLLLRAHSTTHCNFRAHRRIVPRIVAMMTFDVCSESSPEPLQARSLM